MKIFPNKPFQWFWLQFQVPSIYVIRTHTTHTHTHAIIFNLFHLVMFSSTSAPFRKVFIASFGIEHWMRVRGMKKCLKIYYQNLSHKHCESIKYFIGCHSCQLPSLSYDTHTHTYMCFIQWISCIKWNIQE